jgi:UDP-N-acetylglucosamine diphosphorylase/glucosamine-1-phosphate N-acetyltransferase
VVATGILSILFYCVPVDRGLFLGLRMPIILFDNIFRKNLYPLSFTKAVADLRFGILSMRERWEKISGQPVFVHTQKYLQPLYAVADDDHHIWIDAAVIPDNDLYAAIGSLKPGSCLADEKGLIAGRARVGSGKFDPATALKLFNEVSRLAVKRLEHPWQFMQWNDEQMRADFKLLTKNRTSQPLPATVSTMQPADIFIEEGAKLAFCVLNASTGPIYIGQDAEIMEGSVVRGPFAMGKNAVLKMNSRVYGATTLGPSCMGGGEIKNTVMMGYSNKAHDGYLGDSVIGEWCNFGAGSTNSNLKNTAGEVKIWDMASKQYLSVGQKCGVIMGDYSRVAVNSAINTGSVIGVSCNVFGAGLLPTIIPNFSWGVNGTVYELAKALQDIANWKKLKLHSLSEAETLVLQYIFEEK